MGSPAPPVPGPPASSLEHLESASAPGAGPETTKKAAPAALRSFLRNFLSDDLGSFRSEINLKDHGDQSGTEVRDVTVQEVADMHPDLRSLTLSGCDQITDVGLWALARPPGKGRVEAKRAGARSGSGAGVSRRRADARRPSAR